MLVALGEDPDRDGLKETPRRVVDAWSEWFSGYKKDPRELFKTFDAPNEQGLVILTDCPVTSTCEHHLAPFVGVAHVGYLPSDRIIGISKLARVVDIFARRLQVQERLTQEVADCIMENLKPKGVGVIITARHSCMSSRGARTPNVNTTTSAIRGCFADQALRNEFLHLVESSRNKP